MRWGRGCSRRGGGGGGGGAGGEVEECSRRRWRREEKKEEEEKEEEQTDKIREPLTEVREQCRQLRIFRINQLVI